MFVKSMISTIAFRLCVLLAFSATPVFGMQVPVIDPHIVRPNAEIQEILDRLDEVAQDQNLQGIQMDGLRRPVQAALGQGVELLQQRGINIDPVVQGVQQFIGQEAQHFNINDEDNLGRLVGRVRDFVAGIDNQMLEVELAALHDQNAEVNLNIFRGGQIARAVQLCHDFLARQGQNPLLQHRIGDLVDGAQEAWNDQIINNPQLMAVAPADLARDARNVLNQLAQNQAIQNLGGNVGANLAHAQQVLNMLEQNPVLGMQFNVAQFIGQHQEVQAIQAMARNPLAQQVVAGIEDMNIADIPRLAADGIELVQDIGGAATDFQNELIDLHELLEDPDRFVEALRDMNKDNEPHLFKDTVIGDLLEQSIEIPIGRFRIGQLDWHWDFQEHRWVADRWMHANVSLDVNGYDALKIGFFALQWQIEKKLYTQFTEYCYDSVLSNFEQKKEGVIDAYKSIVEANGYVDEASLPLLKKAFVEQFTVRTDIARKPARMLLLFLISDMVREYCEALIIPSQDISNVGLNLIKCMMQEARFREQGRQGAPLLNPVGADRHFQAPIHPVHLVISLLRKFYFGENIIAGLMQLIRPLALDLVQSRYPEDHWYHIFLKYVRKLIGDAPLFDIDEKALEAITDEQEREKKRMSISSWDTNFIFNNGEKIFAWRWCFKAMVTRYQNFLQAHIDKHPDEFLLKVSRLATAYNLEELASAENDVKNFIQSAEQESFRNWVYYKNQSYGQAIVRVEGILLLPGFIEVAKVVGNFGYNVAKAIMQEEHN